MLDFPIPHTPPIRFVKSLISADEENASVEIGFDSIPTLPMLVEAVAQSSSGIVSSNSQIQNGFLVTLKNIKLLEELTLKTYIVKIHLDYKLENFKSFSFSIDEKEVTVATGMLSLSMQ